MDKQILRTVVSDLNIGDTLSINFLGARSASSGDYEVTNKKIGRGKGGTPILSLRSTDGANNEIQIGTPQNREILNIIVNGTLFGFESVDQAPINYETNVARAGELKTQFKTFMTPPTAHQIQIDAPMAPEIHGLWTITGIRQFRGRRGQIVLTVTNSQGQDQQVCSYRHSGVINNVATVPQRTPRDGEFQL